MSKPCLHAFVSVVVLMAMTTHATAAEPAGQSHRCASVVDPDARLICYDAAFPPSAEARSAAQAQRLKALRDFGLRKTQLRSDEPERVREREVAPSLIQAAVARVTTLATGQRVVTLDNGQAWQLTEVTLKGNLKPGDRVVIRGAALGTYMLLTPSRIPLRARRLN